MKSHTNECISCEQNSVKNITKGINSMGVSDNISMCANCGKEGDSLKTCTACRMVKYCNRDCQISHRKQHKKDCKKRVAELHEEALFKEPPPREECPICMLTLLIYPNQCTFKPCCGKSICNGCIYAMEMSEGKDLCAFCRTPPPRSHEENNNQIKKLMDKGNGQAFNTLGCHYANGASGLTQDWNKANELWLKAGELGYADAYYNLGVSYHEGRGAEFDKKKAKHYFELSAMKGSIHGRHNLGMMELQSGNYQRAFKHFMISARAGHTKSLDVVKEGFKGGDVTKDEYAITLRAYQKIQDEMKSDERDKAEAFYGDLEGLT